MRYLLTLLAFVATGCSPLAGLTKIAEVRTTQITWIKEWPQRCGPGPGQAGCAEWTAGHKACTITMPEDSSDIVVSEEFRHCFGYKHIGSN